MTKELKFIVNEQREEYSVYEKGTTQRRIGPYHGVKYIAVPRAFVKHRWIFRDTLGLLGCDIFEVFFLHLGDEGLYPSTYTIADILGITQPAVREAIKNIQTKTLVCPICNYTQNPPLRIIHTVINKRNLSNQYDIIPFLDFLQHIDQSHWVDELNREPYEKALKNYKNSKKKSDF